MGRLLSLRNGNNHYVPFGHLHHRVMPLRKTLTAYGKTGSDKFTKISVLRLWIGLALRTTACVFDF